MVFFRLTPNKRLIGTGYNGPERGETYVIWPRRVFNEGVSFITNSFIGEIKVVGEDKGKII